MYVNFSKPGGVKQDFAEFRNLAISAGVKIGVEIKCRRDVPDPKYFIGQGKVLEIQAQVLAYQADVILFSHILTPAQERNLEQVLQIPILDRTKIILNIFASRARSYEGKLQVELARLEHMATRLVRGWTHLERQRGGIGLRGGPGETQLEVDRRILRQKINNLKKRLDRLEKQRQQNRKSRKRAQVPTIALVGYTNAGKSTLFNSLTAQAAPTADMVFTTLDPLLRRVYLPSFGTIIVADTVGFIKDLPHELIEAFHATLEETKEADLLLHVIDASDPDKNDKISVVNQVLQKIGADQVPQLQVLNKIDLLLDFSPRIDYDANNVITKVWIAANCSLGMELLFDAIHLAT